MKSIATQIADRSTISSTPFRGRITSKGRDEINFNFEEPEPQDLSFLFSAKQTQKRLGFPNLLEREAKRMEGAEFNAFTQKLQQALEQYNPSKCGKSLKLQKVRLRKISELKPPARWENSMFPSLNKRNSEGEDSERKKTKKRKRFNTQSRKDLDAQYIRIVF